MRPWTACAVLRSKSQATPRRSQTTTPKTAKTEFDDADEIDGDIQPIIDENDPLETLVVQKPEVVLVTEKTVPLTHVKRSQSIANPSPHTAASARKDKEFKSLMQFGNEEPTLLEIHKNVVENKQYRRKIDKLKGSIEPLLSTDAGKLQIKTD